MPAQPIAQPGVPGVTGDYETDSKTFNNFAGNITGWTMEMNMIQMSQKAWVDYAMGQKKTVDAFSMGH